MEISYILVILLYFVPDRDNTIISYSMFLGFIRSGHANQKTYTEDYTFFCQTRWIHIVIVAFFAYLSVIFVVNVISVLLSAPRCLSMNFA